jgi:hypothetical protein
MQELARYIALQPIVSFKGNRCPNRLSPPGNVRHRQARPDFRQTVGSSQGNAGTLSLSSTGNADQRLARRAASGPPSPNGVSSRRVSIRSCFPRTARSRFGRIEKWSNHLEQLLGTDVC